MRNASDMSLTPMGDGRVVGASATVCTDKFSSASPLAFGGTTAEKRISSTFELPNERTVMLSLVVVDGLAAVDGGCWTCCSILGLECSRPGIIIMAVKPATSTSATGCCLVGFGEPIAVAVALELERRLGLGSVREREWESSESGWRALLSSIVVVAPSSPALPANSSGHGVQSFELALLLWNMPCVKACWDN